MSPCSCRPCEGPPHTPSPLHRTSRRHRRYASMAAFFGFARSHPTRGDLHGESVPGGVCTYAPVDDNSPYYPPATDMYCVCRSVPIPHAPTLFFYRRRWLHCDMWPCECGKETITWNLGSSAGARALAYGCLWLSWRSWLVDDATLAPRCVCLVLAGCSSRLPTAHFPDNKAEVREPSDPASGRPQAADALMYKAGTAGTAQTPRNAAQTPTL